jgi:hypothetical protein
VGKLTTEIFNESCCDGGAQSCKQSAQSCGCDPGANHLCERHKLSVIKGDLHWLLKRHYIPNHVEEWERAVVQEVYDKLYKWSMEP